MRFKTDENLHPEVAAYLLKHRHDAVTVWDEGLRGKPDTQIIETCRRERRALLTLDVGFGSIRIYPPEENHGIIVLRLDDQSREHVLAVLPQLLYLMQTELVEKRLWVVDERGVRIRGSESELEEL